MVQKINKYLRMWDSVPLEAHCNHNMKLQNVARIEPKPQMVHKSQNN